ncbi:serine/threonine-protein phosphatase 6 regulatory subunit 3-B [Condylostylus longicornis]|uniref:serine/threonine-protein phosphatase 6 regulatory subunit 3-B n=1 Tax=Condylostylus longicornis TaxID=2530218 RepID=UPI00244E0A25|nr:serine/threonine-protein phosphatase 6 regulatory subunit 3-B [Condylostylus longicornis]
MFWDKGYTPSQNIENLLQKDNVVLEEFLDDEDILQECKNQKKNLIQYLTRPDIIKRLIELTITEPPEDVSITQRFKHANMACEILTFGLPSLDEKLVEDEEILQTLYSYLEKEPPLNPLLSSFFNKTFSMLISKKAETDWFLYQKLCLQVLEFIKSRGNFLDLIFRHFATSVIMDLLLQIIREVQGALKKDLYEWLTEQNLVERLISMLGKPEESEKHKNISEFLCELIRYGRSLRQTYDNDSFEQSFVNGNLLLLSIEDHSAVSQLVDVMLLPEAEETTVVAGVKVLLTLADESIVEEPASDLALQLIMDKEKDNHDRIIYIIIDVVEPKINDFHNLLSKPPQRNLSNIYSELPPPFGLTRLQICSLFTILIRIGNSRLIDAICKTDLFNTLLKLFKEYCWNNFLHSEVEKCLKIVFSNNNNNIKKNNQANSLQKQPQEQQQQTENNDNENSNGDTVENPEINPSALQTYAIVNCRVISKLIECWMLNKEMQSSAKGRRLGYMGHLIKIFDTITTSILESDKLGALIESNLSEDELENWRMITNKDEGELIKDLNTQKRMLAHCDAYESAEVYTNLAKEFHNETFPSELFNATLSNLPAFLEEDDEIFGGSSSAGVLYEQFVEKTNFEDDYLNVTDILTPGLSITLNQTLKQLKILVDMGDNDNVENVDNTNNESNSNSDNATDDDVVKGLKLSDEVMQFFADFDLHFNDGGAEKISNGISSTEQDSKNLNEIQQSQEQSIADKSDNNANFEKFCNDKLSSFDDDDNFFNDTKTNAEKIIESIVNDDTNDIIGDEMDNVIESENDNGKIQTDEYDDVLVNKYGENNSFKKVQAEVLDNTNNITINSASNGPVSDEFIPKSSATEVSDNAIKSSNYCNDHTENENNAKSSTAKDTSFNSNEICSNTNKTDVDGGCDENASVVDESS